MTRDALSDPRLEDDRRDSRTPTRRCIATGEVRPQDALIRFVVAPDGTVVPDLARKLPGRGLWVTPSRAAVERAIQKRAFARAARGPAHAPGDLADQVAQQLARRVLDQLGLARRKGDLVTGFAKVADWIDAGVVGLLVEARDGAADGRDKLLRRLRARGAVPVAGCFSAEELSLALGRPNVVHAALRKGGLAHRVQHEVARLAGFRSVMPDDWRIASATANNELKPETG